MRAKLMLIVLLCNFCVCVISVGIRIGTNGKLGLTGMGSSFGSGFGSGLSLPAIRLGSGFGSKSIGFPAIKLGPSAFGSGFSGLPSIKIGQHGSSALRHLHQGYGDHAASSSSYAPRQTFFPVPVPIPMASYPRPMMHRPFPPINPGFRPQVPQFMSNAGMDGMYKMAEEYKPSDEEEEYKMENYKEMSGYQEEKEDKGVMENEKKYKPAKEEYKSDQEGSSSKYDMLDDGRFQEGYKFTGDAGQPSYDQSGGSMDSDYRSSALSMDDSYSSAQPAGYSNNDFYKSEDDKPTNRDELKYTSSDDNTDGNAYRPMTTSYKNLNSGKQDYITLQNNNNKPASNSNKNYPSSIQQQIRQINSHSSSRHRYPSQNHRQNNYDQPPPPAAHKKPAAQSYPVPARAQSHQQPHQQRQHDAYPPPPGKTMKNMDYPPPPAEQPIQQEYEDELPAPRKKSKRPVYDEEEEYERPRRRSRMGRKLRKPDAYEEDVVEQVEEAYPVTKSKRRRPSADVYEDDGDKYKAPKPKSKKRKSSYTSESQESSAGFNEESINDFIGSPGAGGSPPASPAPGYESASSSAAFSFATAPHDFRKASGTREEADAVVPDSQSSPVVDGITRRESLDEDMESSDSRPMPLADSLVADSEVEAADAEQPVDKVERKSDAIIVSDPAAVAAPLAVTQSIVGKDGKIMLPKTEVIHSIKKAIVEAVGRNLEVYDAIGASRLMSKLEELVSTVEAANYPHPYYPRAHKTTFISVPPPPPPPPASPIAFHEAH